MFKNEGLVLLEELVTIFEFILIRLDKECVWVDALIASFLR